MTDGHDDEPAHADTDTERGTTDGDRNPLAGAARRQQEDEEALADLLADGNDDLAATIYEREADSRERLYEGMIGVLLKENKDRFTERVLDDIDLDDPGQVRHAMALIEQYSRNADGSFDETGSLLTDVSDVDDLLGGADGDEAGYDVLVASVEHRYGDEVADVVDQYIERTLAAGQKAGRSYLASELEVAAAEDEEYMEDLADAIAETQAYFSESQSEPARLGEGLRQVTNEYEL